MNECMNGWMDGLVDGWMIVWFDGLMDGWRMDGLEDRQTDRQTDTCKNNG
jgi:hypothetical protein